MQRTLIATVALLVPLYALPALAADPIGDAIAAAREKAKRAAEKAENDVRRALSARIEGVKFEEASLADVLNTLRDMTDANLHVNWRALEAINITRETPITLELRNVPLRQVLRMTLAEASAEGLLTFYADEGVVEITTRELADQKLITKVYPVRDLVLHVPDFNEPPEFNLAQTNSGGRGGGGGQSLIGNTGNRETKASIERARGEELVQTIMQTVRPDAWRENGGTASIRFFDGHLVVTAPRSVHEALGGSFQE